MSKEIEVYFGDRPEGCIHVSGSTTLGTLVIEMINILRKKYSPAKLSISLGQQDKVGLPIGQAIVNSPPSHSNWSFLLIGSRERYIFSFSLVQIENVKNIPLSSAVNRKIDNKILPDIPYSSTERLYIFTSLTDWHRLISFDACQSNIINLHHQYLNSQDPHFRAENQKLRKELGNNIRQLINSPISIDFLLENDHSKKEEGKIQNKSESSAQGVNVSQNDSPSVDAKENILPKPSKDNRQTQSYGALPGFTSSNKNRGRLNQIKSSSAATSCGALPGFTVPVVKPSQTKEKKIAGNNPVRRSLIDSLNDPSGIITPLSQDVENTSDSLVGIPLEPKIGDQEKEDYHLAQALHIELNDCPPPNKTESIPISTIELDPVSLDTIEAVADPTTLLDPGAMALERMIQKGIAVSSFTGRPGEAPLEFED